MSQSRRPNIVVIFSDQQRWDTLGCYGQKLPVSPHLDRMAEEGVRFELAFTCQPVCGPVRACLQTGRYATEVGCHTNHRHLPRQSDTLAARMKSAGYRTAYIGKWHLASGPNELEPGYDPDYRIFPVPEELRGGYDYWLASDVLEFTSHSYDGYMFGNDGKPRFFPVGRYRADVQTDWVEEYLDQQTGDEPFFLFTSYIEPHQQNDHDRFEGPRGSKEYWSNYEIPGDLAGIPGDWVENYPDYLGCCHALDRAVGRIRERLAARGLLDNTLILYTSDHGSHFRTRNREYKRSCHDGCLRIPMIMRGPGFSGGEVNRSLASLIDLPRTILTAAGAEPPAVWQGIALQEARGRDDLREAVFAQLSESQVGRCLRTRRWKYSVTCRDGGSTNRPAAAVYHEDFLYDLEADPHERRNLVRAPEYAGVRAELRDMLFDQLRAAGETMPEIRPCDD